MTRLAWLVPFLTVLACDGSTTEPTPAGGNGTTSSAATCSETAGATWSIEKSKFAFGGAPVQDGPNHWTGPEGAAVGPPNALAIPNSGASAQARPDFSGDVEVLKTHVKEYLMGFGIRECQISNIEVLASFGGGGPVGGPTTQTAGHRTISLSRAIDGIPVAESHANATMNDQDQSTNEGLFWPELPADVVAGAKVFRDQLKDPATLEAYKAKLPTNFGPITSGQVMIHHSLGFGDQPLKFYFAWDAIAGNSPVSFDADGNRVVQTPF
jgi:hypothetical protein